MSKFRVGMRVIKARGTVNVGLEGVVVGLSFVPSGSELHTPRGLRTLGHDSDIQIIYATDWVGGSGASYPASFASHGISGNYEPIVPDGHRSGDYSYTELMDRLKAGEVECV